MDEGPKLLSRFTWLPLLVAVLLFTGLGGLVSWQWYVLQASDRLESEQDFELTVDDIAQRIADRMRAHEVLLRGMAGLFADSSEVSRQVWQQAASQLQQSYPDIQALGWAHYLPKQQLQAFLEGERQSTGAALQLFPPGIRDDYLIVTYLAPPDALSLSVPGFDILSEPLRRQAVEQARDSGAAVLSGPLHLQQQSAPAAPSGVLLFIPVYRPHAPLGSLGERRAALLGVVYGAFRTEELLAGLLGKRSALFQLQLADSGASDAPLLSAQVVGQHPPLLQQIRELELYGRHWRLAVSSTPQYEQTLGNSSRSFGLWGGLLAAALLALLAGGYLYLRDRAQASRQLLSERLNEREERFRLVVEASPNAVVLVDAQGLIVMVNRQTEQMFGYPRAQLLNQPVEMLLPQALRPNHVGMRQGFQKAPEPRRMGGNRELFGQHREGQLIPLEVGLSPLRSGMDVLVQAVIIDISARKAAEERFRLVVEASPNAIVLVDSQGLIVMVNQQTEQMFGYPREQLLNQPVEMLLPESLRAAHVGMRQGFQKAPEPRRMGGSRELFGRHREGQLIPLEVGLSPLRSGDDVLVQAVIIDISARKEAEQRLREQAEQLALANRYKTEFLANMSHELRTPLNSILILSDQLKQNSTGNLTGKQVQHADIVHKAGSDLLQLINDVLDLAKVEAGRVQLSLEPLNVREMLQELDASMRPQAELKGLRLLRRVADDVPQMILSDRVRLHQILRNLLSNALKFTDQGEVELQVSIESSGLEPTVTCLCLVVRDTGIGIAAEQHERIFQAFQQLDGSTSRRYGGTGLGLAITRQLIEALGGDIQLQSQAGQGSEFTVRLPVEVLSEPALAALRVAAEQLALPSVNDAPGPRQLQGQHVLLVDDDVRNIYALMALLDELGLRVTAARDGVEALACYQQARFALILMDMAMPNMDGYTATRLLKQEYGCVIPIIALTAHAMKGDREKCLAAGADDYLAKPVARQELLNLLYRWLDRPRGGDHAAAK
ncbi:MAG: hypothetical protein A2Y50_10875 [Pseudomonadales bacterium RIFCSPLOWO2_12_59_9]|nr:MAG: hypothetical protein A2Y50_10875 [Pseudomonadales bacterium RIFCSPLOWO2_12_59_9]